MKGSPNMKCCKQIGISLPQRLTFAVSRTPMSGPRDMRNASGPELRHRMWQPIGCNQLCASLDLADPTVLVVAHVADTSCAHGFSGPGTRTVLYSP